MIGQWITPVFAPMGIQASNWPATVGLLTGVLAKEVVVGTLNTLYAQMGHDVYGLMAQQFAGGVGAFAYLLFVLLYFPCVSTMAAMTRELHRGWAVFSMCWSTGIAYIVAVVFYQAATFVEHPVASASWIAGLLAVFFAVIGLVVYASRRRASEGRQMTKLATESA
jgi:ferrous iron transport protein B